MTVMTRFQDFVVSNSDGEPFALSRYSDQVVLVVNVASQCGFTPQYRELEALYQQYAQRGFVVLAFPCNQFGGQEPGEAEQIQAFCESKYQISFPVLAKVDVNGQQAEPLFQWLKSACPGVAGTQSIKWNFTKFLLNRQGEVVARFSSRTKPSQIVPQIEALL